MLRALSLGLLVVSAAASANAACPAGTESRGVDQGEQVCALKGSYLNSKLVLTTGSRYLLDGGVYIGGDNKQNSELYIEPGVTLVGNSGRDFLVITRGSKIFAEGTKQKPIVFTANKRSGRKRGEFGGLVLNGNAPINACKPGASVCEAEAEGNVGAYGGKNPEDSSGVLRYVRVEFAGFPVAPDNELNGITFNAVGRGTKVEYIQVHNGSDDGIEFFGGNVDVRHVVLTGNEDDAMDWDYGWQGRAQFVVIEQAMDAGDNGIEADNNRDQLAASPRSLPTLSNVTLIGGSAKGGYGMLLRKGTGAKMHNVILTGFKKAAIDIDDNETFRHGGTVSASGQVDASGLVLTHSLVSGVKAFEASEKDKDGNPIMEPWAIEAWFKGQTGNLAAEPKLKGWYPTSASPAIGAGESPDDSWFDFVDYMGAFADESDDWAKGWITSAKD